MSRLKSRVMNKTIFIIITSLLFGYVIHASLRTNYNSEEAISSEFQNAYYTLQPKEFIILKRTPVLSDFKNGEIIISKVGSTVKLYCRVDNSTYSTTMN